MAGGENILTPGGGLIFLAIIAAAAPTIFWLWFWLKEDKRRPEPKPLIVAAFVLGAAAVLPAYLGEKLLAETFNLSPVSGFGFLVLSWATIEELIKAGAAYWGALRQADFDEPVDAMIYMITAALGFAAAENIIFVLASLFKDPAGATFLIAGNLRFVGATILHVVSSAIFGLFIALGFCQRQQAKKIPLWTAGALLAIALHAVFNYFIINSSPADLFKVLFAVWLSAVAIILLFEVVKNRLCRLR